MNQETDASSIVIPLPQLQLQTLCGQIFYLDNKSFAIACTLCEQQYQEPEDFFGHILADHVYENDSSEFEENELDEYEDLPDDEQMETVYLDEEFTVKECDDSSDVLCDLSPGISNPEKYAQYVKNFEELEPLLSSISKCHWLWSGRNGRHKIKSSSLRFLRHKYYLSHIYPISAKDLEYKIRLLRSMRRVKRESGLEDEYIRRLEFLDDFNRDMLQCPDEDCDFITEDENEVCQHIFKAHFVPDEKIYKCERCDMKTKTYKTYLKHIKACASSSRIPKKRQRISKLKVIKPDNVSLQCLTCGEQMGEDIEAFNQHMRQHNKIVKTCNLKPLYKCETVRTKSVKRPVSKSLPEDDLECDICGLTLHFADVEKFNEHMRMHNKIQLFKCRVCRKFSGSHVCEECSLFNSLDEKTVIETVDVLCNK